MQGWVNEPCPAQWQFGEEKITCEYVLHGKQSNNTCCPHGLTSKGPYQEDCGCRDDLTETPYRMAYVQHNNTLETTTFTLNMALVEAWRTEDFDGMDFDLNHEVNCSAMGIKDIKLDIFSYYEVLAVRFNNVTLDYQVTANTPYSNWLWVLGVDYATRDLLPYTPVTVEVDVRGNSREVTELCPAAAKYGSLSSCEYIVAGWSPNYDECCPKGTTSWFTPARLQYSAGYTWVKVVK